MNRIMRASFLGMLMVGVSGISFGATPEDVETASQCVAYRTEKTMFFLFDVGVTGWNCSVDTQVFKDSNRELWWLEISIPVEGFDSGSGLRDEHVAEILGGRERKALILRSSPVPSKWYQAILEGEARTMAGELIFHDHSQQVRVLVWREKDNAIMRIHTRLTATFSGLGLHVPSVGPGGMIADLEDQLELLGRFDAKLFAVSAAAGNSSSLGSLQ